MSDRAYKACWADGDEEYIISIAGGGYNLTRECEEHADPGCALGLCQVHCSLICDGVHSGGGTDEG